MYLQKKNLLCYRKGKKKLEKGGMTLTLEREEEWHAIDVCALAKPVQVYCNRPRIDLPVVGGARE